MATVLISFVVKEGQRADDAQVIAELKALRDMIHAKYGASLLFNQVEDNRVVYLLCSPPNDNKDISATLEGSLSLALLTLSSTSVVNVAMNALPLSAPVIAIGRHVVKAEDKHKFNATWHSNAHLLKEFTPHAVAGGWRIEAAEGTDEWILWSGWDAIQSHVDFGNSAQFKEYIKIKEYMIGGEVKHATLLKI